MSSEFSKQIAVRLAARQFWLDGALSSPCCPVFLETDDRRTWKIFYDDEHGDWAIGSSDEAFPFVGRTTGDNELRWIDVEITGADALVGRRIIEFQSNRLDGVAIGKLLFDGEKAITFRHFFKDEQQTFSIEG